MAALRSAVYVAPPTPISNPSGKGNVGHWSPISCTLIYSAREAILVDTPITIKQTEELISWIERIAPGRKLSYIYITHGHGDHFFGIPVLLQRFPEAKAVATAATVRHMEHDISPDYYEATWESLFSGQIYRPFQLAEPLPLSKEFMLEGRWKFQAVEVGHTDTNDSTILWVPELRLAICGDVVYGQVHQMLFEANTKAKREEWIRAVEMIEDLRPAYVVPGHKQAEEIDGIWHLVNTKKYIEDFGKALATNPRDPKELFEVMMKLYPDRLNPGALKIGCIGAFQAPKEQRI